MIFYIYQKEKDLSVTDKSFDKNKIIKILHY